MEEESKRIANSLHDEGSQLLAAVHLALADLEQELAAPERARLQRVRDMLHDVESALRRLSHELRPALLDDLGLEPAVRFHADGVAQRNALRVVVTGSTEGRIQPEVETVFYRVVQEALQNVVRHAEASQATVYFRRDAEGLRCFIADNGKGFEPGSVARKADAGMGLMGIRDRLGLVGGTLVISAGSNGRGTVLVAFVPLP
jgi:signal transduction histidine kinase